MFISWQWHCRNSLQLLKAADFLTLWIPHGYSDNHCNLSTVWSLPEAHKYQQILEIPFSVVGHSLGTLDVTCPINMTAVALFFPPINSYPG